MYVLGMIFDIKDPQKTVLVTKKKPDWQAGLYNSPGGKIEPGENGTCAVMREVMEETGMDIPASEWHRVMLQTHTDNTEMEVFRTFQDLCKMQPITTTDDPVSVVFFNDLPKDAFVGNLLSWLSTWSNKQTHPYSWTRFA